MLCFSVCYIYQCVLKFNSVLASALFPVQAPDLLGHSSLTHFLKISILLDNFQISENKAVLVRVHAPQPIVQLFDPHTFLGILCKSYLVLATCLFILPIWQQAERTVVIILLAEQFWHGSWAIFFLTPFFFSLLLLDNNPNKQYKLLLYKKMVQVWDQL